MSINNQLDRVRKPRVHIKYDVEIEGAQVSKELPFSIACIGDYAGPNPKISPKPLKDRSFITIDRDNFDLVMASIEPGVDVRFKNILSEGGGEASASLSFKSMKSFEPDEIIKQVPHLKALKKIRDQLSELLTKADVSEDLESLLEQVLQDSSKITDLSSLLNQGEGRDD